MVSPKNILAFALIALVQSGLAAEESRECPCCFAAVIEEPPQWISYGGIVFILVVVILMFWALAYVCEEFFVPALNTLCEEWKIPDDVAGATLMAAGASSPELFTSFIGLIVYQSNIGVGTVVGSEIFNHMIISAGSVLFAKGGVLVLDQRIVLRDLFFYMASLLLMVYSLKDNVFTALEDTFNSNAWEQCLNVTTLHGAVLLLFYILYAIVAGNYQSLTRMLCPREGGSTKTQGSGIKECGEEGMQLQHRHGSDSHSDAHSHSHSPSSAGAPPSSSPHSEGRVKDAEGKDDKPVPEPPSPGIIVASRKSTSSIYADYLRVGGAQRRVGSPRTPHTPLTPESISASRASSSSNVHGRLRSASVMSRVSREDGHRPARSTFSPTLQANPQQVSFENFPNAHDDGLITCHRTVSSQSNVLIHLRPSELARFTRPVYGRTVELPSPVNEKEETQVHPVLRSLSGLHALINPSAQDEEEGHTEIHFVLEEEQTERRESSVPDYLKASLPLAVWQFLLDAAPPADIGMYHVSPTVLHCYLYVYQDCIGLDALPPYMTWQLRYFTANQHGLHSTTSPTDPHTGLHIQLLDLSTAQSLTPSKDPKDLSFSINFNNDVVKAIHFRAPTEEIFQEAKRAICAKILAFKSHTTSYNDAFFSAAQEELWVEPVHGEEGYHIHNMLDVPTGRYAIIWYVLTLPLLLCFHYTLLDVRLPGNNIYYGRMILLCVFYLAVFSYIMILCCDEIGNFIGTTPTVMGLTLAAVGTSFPNLWASMIVARQGYGNMAICNALGSNIFNVDVALGGPWFVFLLIRGGKPYQDMKDHGIVMFVVMLLAVCVIWLGMIVSRGFKMEAWMAPIFVLIYLAVIVAAVFLS